MPELAFLKDRHASFSSERSYTPEGYLVVRSKIARVGLQKYLARELNLADRDPNSIVVVYRPPSEVFSKDSLQSLGHKPITNNHPKDLVSAENHKTLSVGFTSEKAVESGDYVESVLTFTDLTAIKDVESGKVELSVGYTSAIDLNPGKTPEGEDYDVRQTNIVGNHLAIVPRGRAGSECRVADEDSTSTPTGDTRMPQRVINGISYEVTDQVAQVLDQQTAALDAANSDLKTERTKNQVLTDKAMADKADGDKAVNTLQAKIDVMDSEGPGNDGFNKLVTAQVTLIDQAKSLVTDVVWKDKSPLDIKKAVIAKLSPTINLDGKSEDYVQAMYDHFVVTADTNSQHTLDTTFSDMATAGQGVTTITDTRTVSEIARDKAMENGRNAWKKKA